MKICIIEDDMLVRKSLSKVLARAGHLVFASANGRDGLIAVEAENPDLVITDIIMPEMPGLELIKHLRHMKFNLAIIAMSGGGRVGNMDFLKVARRIGADAVLYKPVTRTRLLKAVDTCLAGRCEASAAG